MRTSFLEYAYSVIYARALPDARDGLKPVQRRIVYMMSEMGLWPNKGHVKSSRVVGEVMGKLHPHGDSAIYDAIVRLAQDFNLRMPLVDGHGNFGSLDDGPAAARYTEVRMAPTAQDMVSNLDEDVVDFVPNYDNQFLQPAVLPAAFPNLLVNGANGIAVGMATYIAPHNLGETVAGAIHLLENPEASTEDLMRFIPGPDLPGGGIIVGLDGIRQAYETGRGIFRTRAKTSIERVSARKMGIVVTELPYMVGPEKVIEKIKDGVQKGRLKGISAVTNLTDREHDLRLVIEVKSGFNPEAVRASLFKHTPMEDSFGINAVALVDGQPRTLGLKEMLQVFLDHRMEIVMRRSQYRLRKRQERLHLVRGLLIAVLDIDDVIQIIRASEDSAQAKSRLMEAFDLDEVQAEHILSLQLRRLTKFSRLELEAERDRLTAEIAELESLIASQDKRKELVASELREVAQKRSDPRRTVLLEEEGAAQLTADQDTPLEIPDEPATVVLGAGGLVARFPGHEALSADQGREPWDTIISTALTTARGQVGAVTSHGTLYKLAALEVPALVRSAAAPSLRGTPPISRLLPLEDGEEVVGLVPLDEDGPIWWAATSGGVIKRIRPQVLATQDSYSIITLESGDQLVAAGSGSDDGAFVLISSAAQLLRTPADKVRPQGRTGQGISGMKLSEGDQVITAALVSADALESSLVVTVAGIATSGPGSGQTSAKVTPLLQYPQKGRAGQGVRCQRFLKGESRLALAAITATPPRALAKDGSPLSLPAQTDKRDASGSGLKRQIYFLG
ncbi:DNA topoisomerase IV subunit A [Varibaculum cambriense]|uniref:DNA gyrase/topoisomerase IV subunit A n=1 Tax=Varibaculum cambriense TaxID=184870 RepID=UPI00241D841F|nr:DNA topoisomerase IV subunit A [Varibaculum cambriense]